MTRAAWSHVVLAIVVTGMVTGCVKSVPRRHAHVGPMEQTEWRAAGGGMDRRAAGHLEGVPRHEAWRWSPEDTQARLTHFPAMAAHGVVLVSWTSGDIGPRSCLTGLDAASGQVLWEHEEPSYPLLAAGENGVAALAGRRAEWLDPRTGDIVWQRETLEADSLLVVDSVVACVLKGQHVTALSADQGMPLWEWDAGDQSARPAGPCKETLVPCAGAGRIIVPCPGKDGLVVCLEAATGRELWRKRVGGHITAPLVLGEETVFVRTATSLSALDVADGKIRWQIDMPDEPPATSLAISGDDLYEVSANQVFRINASSGQVVSQLELPITPTAIAGWPLLVSEQFVILLGPRSRLGAVHGEVVAIDRQTQEVAWSMAPLRDQPPMQILLSDGRLILTAMDTVVCLGP